MKKHCGRLAVLIVIICAVLLPTLSGFAAAKVVKPTSDFYVRDDARVLSAETVEYIVSNNDVLFEETGAQIVFVVLSTTGSTSAEDYAYTLFNEWKIGSAEHNNGLLVLMAVDDDDYYSLQGRGLEDYISGGDLGDYNREYLEPYFARREYDRGARALFDALYAKVASIYSADTRYPQAKPVLLSSERVERDRAYSENRKERNQKESLGGGFSTVVLILVLVTPVLLTVFSSRGRRGRRNRSSGGAGGFFWGMLLGRQMNRNNRKDSWYNSPPPPRGSSTRGGFGGSSTKFGGGSGRSGGGGSRSGGGGSSRGGGAGRGR